MIALLIFLLRLLVLPARPELQLKAENAAPRQQLPILQRKQRGRVQWFTDPPGNNKSAVLLHSL
jgi:hypothetical protein